MNRNSIEKLLLEFKEQGVPDDLIDRNIKIVWSENKVNVLAGIRRAGKTYLMYQLIKELNKENSYYINFEDDRLINPKLEDLSSLLDIIKELFNPKGKIYLFVDEIQNVDGWEKWCRRMSENKNIILFVSGSSSKLTSYEIPTYLRGRSLTNIVYPLDLKEFLKFKGFDADLKTIDYSPKKPTLLGFFNEYLTFGGFPEIVLEKDRIKKIRILQDYYITILMRDIEERYNIKNRVGLENFLKYLINNYSSQISFSKAVNWLRSVGIRIGKQTLMEYYKYIKESFFIRDVQIFSYSIKDREQYPIKIYLVDNGFVTALTAKQERGKLFEQLVANLLFKAQDINPSIKIYYYRTKEGYEVDFMVEHNNTAKQLVQVSAVSNFDEIDKREIRALLHAKKELNCDNLAVITDNYEGVEQISWFGIKAKITFTPLWKWLLGNN